MKKAILKRIGSLILICFMVFLNVFALLVPAFAEENEQSDPACIFSQYENLDVHDEDLFEGMSEWINGLSFQNHGYFELRNLVFNVLPVVTISYHYGEIGILLKLDPNRYYVLKKNQFSSNVAFLQNSQGENLGQVLFQNAGEGGYGYVFQCDPEYRYLYVSDISGFSCSLYEVAAFDTVYDVSRTSVQKDFEVLFPGIDLSEFTGVGVSDSYIKPIAIYEEGTVPDISGVYLYLFVPLSGYYVNGSFVGGSLDLISVYGKFYKFRVRNWNYETVPEGRKYHFEDPTLNFSSFDEPKTFALRCDFIVSDGENGQKNISMELDSTVKLEVHYTYWRDPVETEPYHHGQIDSIYFNVPNYLLRNYGRIVNARLQYNRARTKPIFVTDEPGLYVNYLKKYLFDDPHVFENSSRLRIGFVDLIFTPGISYRDFNGPVYFDSSHLESCTPYWTFLVSDADAGIRDPASTVLSSSVLQYLYDYSDRHAAVNGTIHAAGRDGKGQDVPVDLFELDSIQRNVTIDVTNEDGGQASEIEIRSYANTHGWFAEFINFGPSYMISQDNENHVVSLSMDPDSRIIPIDDINKLNASNVDAYRINEKDLQEMRNSFPNSSSDQTMILMHFGMSDYFYQPVGWEWGAVGPFDPPVEGHMYVAQEDLYLDLHVLTLTFEDSGNYHTVFIPSTHVDCAGDITQETTPKDEEIAALKGLLPNLPRPNSNNIFGFLKKALVIIAVVVIVLVVLRLVMWIVGRKQSNNTTVVIRDDAPRRNRRRRR